jgi:uncharacterized protein
VFDSDLAQYDASFLFTTGNLTEAGTDNALPMSVQGKEALLAAIRDGKGFLGVHSASDTFHSKGSRFETQQQPEPYIAMLGGKFLGHGSQQEARVKVVDANFPGLGLRHARSERGKGLAGRAGIMRRPSAPSPDTGWCHE